MYIGVSTVVKTPIRSSTTILPSSTKGVSTTMILSTQKVMPTTSNIIPKNTPTGIYWCCHINNAHTKSLFIYIAILT